MNIETANRLAKLRKKHGLSQEDLADKLGISRQAVSKWERAEASPDTDNLISLAKLYNMSLDDLLNSDEEEIPQDNTKKEEEKEKETKRDYVNIGLNGIHISSKEGDEVHIDTKGIHVNSEDVVVDRKPVIHINERCTHPLIFKIGEWINAPLLLLALIAFLLLGFLGHYWNSAWILFLVPEIIASILRAIGKGKFSLFNAPFFFTALYFFLCMVYPGLEANIWHIAWVSFLGIPLYYALVGPLDKILGKRKTKIKIKTVDADSIKEED